MSHLQLVPLDSPSVGSPRSMQSSSQPLSMLPLHPQRVRPRARRSLLPPPPRPLGRRPRSPPHPPVKPPLCHIPRLPRPQRTFSRHAETRCWISLSEGCPRWGRSVPSLMSAALPPSHTSSPSSLRLRFYLPSGFHQDCIYPGSKFIGTQKSGRNSYDVSIEIVVRQSCRTPLQLGRRV